MWSHLLLLVPVAIAALFGFLPWTTALPIAVVLTTAGVMVVAEVSGAELRVQSWS